MNTKIRFNINSQAVAKTASLISNGVLLTANAYLIGSGFSSSYRERRNQSRNQNLQLTAEIASAIASLTKVVTDTLNKHNNETG